MMNDKILRGDIVIVNRTSNMSEDTYNPCYNGKIARVFSEYIMGYCVVFKPLKKATNNYMWFVNHSCVQLLLKDTKLNGENIIPTVS